MGYLDNNGLLYVWSKVKSHVATQVSTKVDKVSGKGLSTNDYTTAEKSKLAGIADQATRVIVEQELVNESTNPLSGKVVQQMIKNVMDGVTLLANDVANKVDKVDGKGLSTNDYTTAEKSKLSGIAANANNYAHPTGDGNKHVPATGTTSNGKALIAGSTAGDFSWKTLTQAMIGLTNVDNTSDISKPISTQQQIALDKKWDYAKHTSNGTIDANTLTQQGYHYFDSGCTLTNFPSDPLLSSNPFSMLVVMALGNVCQILYYQPDRNYVRQKTSSTSWGVWTQYSSITDSERNTWNGKASTALVTTSANGLMSKDDKVKLNGIATGATRVIVEQELVNESSNPLAGKVVQQMIKNVMDGVEVVAGQLDGKVDKITGKGLSTNDYTTAEKNKLAQFGAASTYALKTDLSSIYKYMGSVTNENELPPAAGVTTGWVYNIVNVSSYGGPGTNVAWDGTKWDSLGGQLVITSITNAEIDTICA